MAINSNRGSITTTRGTIFRYPMGSGAQSHLDPGQDIFVRSTTGTAYLGGTGVTKLTGYPLLPGAAITINMDPGETLCAVRAESGTTTIRYLTSTRD